MHINGAVIANHDGQAYKILMELVKEGILDYFELDGRENMSDDEINSNYNAVVDGNGYLNLAEDYNCPLSEVTADCHTFGFEGGVR